MVRTIEVEIDTSGHVHPVEPGAKLPAGRAILTLPISEDDAARYIAESALSDWLRPEEDEAWAYLQPAK